MIAFASFVARVSGLTSRRSARTTTRSRARWSRRRTWRKCFPTSTLAREEGGTVLCGGNAFIVEGRCEGDGSSNPTVIETCPSPAARTRKKFSVPWSPSCPSKTEAEVLAMANGTPYGLAASVWTRDLTRAHRVSAALQTGIVWVNCWMLRDLRTPFGGVKHGRRARRRLGRAAIFHRGEKRLHQSEGRMRGEFTSEQNPTTSS
jgi:acyl-CoA reductase-like NAD-dependent aldehyde dehydrogenase